MGNFTITTLHTVQQERFFLPSANGCNIDLTPVGEANNWECVDDPRAVPDDDVTYVHSSVTDLNYDLYEIPNHTTEAGTINYIQIYSRAKSHVTSQHPDGIYKIILTDNACGNIYKSNDFDLITSYDLYDNVWTTNPRTTNAWTWDDIDNLQIGTESSSPTTTTAPLSLVIRPTGMAGGCLHAVPDIPNWSCVNDVTEDGFDSYVWIEPASSCHELYELANHTTETGTITKVSIFAYIHGEDIMSYANTAIYTQATDYVGVQEQTDPVDTWIMISTDYVINPNTLVAWTWADIDNLQGGVILTSFLGKTYCTQVYIIVEYNANISPEIRTTQTYMKVNYNDVISCSLTKPQEISVDHDQNVTMLNFWSGNREVYGLERNKRAMVMRGKLYSEDACTIIECIKTIGDLGQDIVMEGLGSNNYDRKFKIHSFGWKKISDKPLAYEWILESEYS